MQITADLSNVVVLLDGIKNNHEIELSVEGSQRARKLLRISPQYVFPLKRSNHFLGGLYFHDDLRFEKLWVAVVGYGDFSSGVNNETISSVEVGVVSIRKDHLELEIVKHIVQDYFQTLNPRRECVVLALFNQEELFKRAKSVQQSTFKEIVCSKLIKRFMPLADYQTSKNSS